MTKNTHPPDYAVYMPECPYCKKGILSKLGFKHGFLPPQFPVPTLFQPTVLICDNDDCGTMIKLEAFIESYSGCSDKLVWHDVTDKCLERWLDEKEKI